MHGRSLNILTELYYPINDWTHDAQLLENDHKTRDEAFTMDLEKWLT